MKLKAEITFETKETMILKRSDSYLVDFCPCCQATVPLMPPEILAALTIGTEREIFRLIEAGKIYFVEARRLYACPDCYRKSLHDPAFRTTQPGPIGSNVKNELEMEKP